MYYLNIPVAIVAVLLGTRIIFNVFDYYKLRSHHKIMVDLRRDFSEMKVTTDQMHSELKVEHKIKEKTCEVFFNKSEKLIKSINRTQIYVLDELRANDFIKDKKVYSTFTNLMSELNGGIFITKLNNSDIKKKIAEAEEFPEDVKNELVTLMCNLGSQLINNIDNTSAIITDLKKGIDEVKLEMMLNIVGFVSATTAFGTIYAYGNKTLPSVKTLMSLSSTIHDMVQSKDIDFHKLLPLMKNSLEIFKILAVM